MNSAQSKPTKLPSTSPRKDRIPAKPKPSCPPETPTLCSKRFSAMMRYWRLRLNQYCQIETWAVQNTVNPTSGSQVARVSLPQICNTSGRAAKARTTARADTIRFARVDRRARSRAESSDSGRTIAKS